jgi:hypothetical protein
VPLDSGSTLAAATFSREQCIKCELTSEIRCFANAREAGRPRRSTSRASGAGIPAKVSKRYRSLSVTPSAIRANATAIIDPPLNTPHSTNAPGISLRTM